MKCLSIRLSIYARLSVARCITSSTCNVANSTRFSAPLRGYLHCLGECLVFQNYTKPLFTFHSVHNLFEIGLMKGVRYFVEVLSQCLRPSTFDDIVQRSRTESTEKIYTVTDKQDQQ